MKKVKLLILLPSNSLGGAEKVMLSYFNNFQNNTIESHLLITNNKGYANIKKSKNITQLNFSRFMYSVPKLVKIIHKERFDFVISTFPNISIILLLLKLIKICKIKLIIRQPNMISTSLNYELKLIILKHIYKNIIKHTDALIVTSKYMYKEAIENKVNVNKIHLISNPISLAETRKGVRPLRTKGEKIKLIFVGRLVYQKGIDRVLHLFHNQSNLELLLVGNGNEKERLLSKTKKYGNTKNIFFLGQRKNPFDLVAGADYFLLPSRWEGMPNCVLESLSLGTPVLAFKQIFSLKDLDKNLYSNNSVSLSENIEELKIKMKSLERRKDYRKPKLRKSLIKNFSSPRIYQEKINNIILNLL